MNLCKKGISMKEGISIKENKSLNEWKETHMNYFNKIDPNFN